MTTKPTPASAVANLLSRLQKGRNTRQKGAFGGQSRYQKAQRAAKKGSAP